MFTTLPGTQTDTWADKVDFFQLLLPSPPSELDRQTSCLWSSSDPYGLAF